ncbi:hypothetical protein TNCV_4614601 [Trichonephila clavipes]|nr:hypothetical protein TNCV_4614601 [Trichonephila clavipes]
MNKSGQVMHCPFLVAAGCQSTTRWVHRRWIMERLSKVQKTKEKELVNGKSLPLSLSQTKTGKVRAEREGGVLEITAGCNSLRCLGFWCG